ncbi:hypothetical protein HHL16_09410 [Pseudoflavitalea sp. G-6-1-2]|uniref:hypothetical protein n=1 Tax=Pseudoflavitalea sp. G-6-1-2 TaxID=2728841 RepID=UPI00146C98F3|nr:hypothetical protein [Pseudoflavitalea sp. G-6-1-2]NML21090.1 hypothetical protein [Pseudoflavitalea sp. G-6-1-2]
MRKITLLAVFALSLLSIQSSAQQYIPYKAYVSGSGPFGQPFLRYQHADNFLYSATSRFTVTSTPVDLFTPDALFDGGYDGMPYKVAANGTGTITIDMTTKGTGNVTYPGGKFYLHFYGSLGPQSITGRFRISDGTWKDITNWTNIATIPTNNVWEGTLSSNFNGLQVIEITLTAPAAQIISMTEMEYIMDRPNVENGLVTKFSNQTLYKNFEWRGVNNDVTSYIKSDGNVVFRGPVGINNTPLAGFTLHVQGNTNVVGTLKATGFTMPTNAVAGRVLTTDATGIGTWKDLPAGSGTGWGQGGSSVGAIKMLGTIDNFDLPIITNNVERMRISSNGSVGIGTTQIATGYKLYVEGNIRARKVRVDNSTWPDYVFEKEYALMPLSELEQFIQQNRHLPGVPTAAEVHKEGVDLGSNAAIALKKIEELTLYTIDLQKQVESHQKLILEMQKKLQVQDKAVDVLENKQVQDQKTIKTQEKEIDVLQSLLKKQEELLKAMEKRVENIERKVK